MIYTYKGLRDEVLRLLDETATENPTTLNLVKDFINQAHQQRTTEHPWQFMLWPAAHTFSIVEGQREYALHQEFHRPLYLWNTTSKQYCRELPFRALPQSDPNYDWHNDTGDSVHFMYWGLSSVREQPDTPSVISLVSDNAADSGSSYDIVIKGENTDGVVLAEKLTPTGLTTVSGTITFRRILGVTKGGGWNGNLYLYAGTQLIHSLLPCEMGRQYKTIYYVEAGHTGEIIEYRFYRQPLYLINDYDIPEIPAPHSQILVWDALVMMSGYLTETNPQTLRIWREKQMEAQLSLYQAYGTEGQTLEAQPTFVRYMDEWSW